MFALAALLAPANAAMQTIIVEGYFTQQIHSTWWNDADPPELPICYTITCTYDDEAEDEEASSDWGVYETPSGVITLDFELPDAGPIHVEIPTTEVQVWNGKDGLKGISFGNDEAFTDYGEEGDSNLVYPEYYGIYVSLRVPYSREGVTVTSDSLSTVLALQDNSVLAFDAYAYLDGVSYWNSNFQVQLRDNQFVYYLQ